MVWLKDIKKYPCKSKGFIWTTVVVPGTKEHKELVKSLKAHLGKEYKNCKHDPHYYKKNHVEVVLYRKKLRVYATGKQHVESLLNDKRFTLVYADTHKGRVIHVNGILNSPSFAIEAYNPRLTLKV